MVQISNVDKDNGFASYSFSWCCSYYYLPSIRVIAATEVGLVTKRFGFKKLTKDSPIALSGEAGYQSGASYAKLRQF